MMGLASLPIALTLVACAVAQYFPAEPKNVTVVKSQIQDGVFVSYKEVWATAFAGASTKSNDV